MTTIHIPLYAVWTDPGRIIPILTAQDAFEGARKLAVAQGLDVGRLYVVEQPETLRQGVVVFAQGEKV